MKKNIIQETIISHINELNSIFIFPTQTSADLWADRITEVSGTCAVAMERFVAWDKFKSSSIKSTHQNKKSIPSVMRSFFASQIIEENAENPFLKNLIMPEYSKTASGFADWITSLLPSLCSWKKYFDSKNLTPDEEDEDFLLLYNKYSAFLDKNGLFDPAWEFPPFKADGNHYYIFFPEILSDYFEYEKILSSSDDITLINFKDVPEEQIPDTLSAKVFKNGRLEVKNVALYLKKLHDEEKIGWNEIALNVPDLDSYGPYIERELSLYQIPYVTKNAQPLSSACAGNFFRQIYDCVQEKFSFNSIRNLILNTELPWISPELNSQLIDFGKNNRCVCGFDYKDKFFDPWKESFETNPQELRLFNYYKGLKSILTALVNASSFKEIHTLYFKFRENYFSSDYEPRTDKIISRCLVALTELMELEEEFSECKVKSPYKFFISQLDSAKYLEQTDQNGVQILPYKMAATAPFKCHIVLDSSQSSLSVVYKQMSFLREDKRKNLFDKNYEDPNVSEDFIKLYAMNSTQVAALFTVSEKPFSGYSQVSSYLKEEDHKSEYIIEELSKYDSYKSEKEWYLYKDKAFPEKISKIQRDGFENWLNYNEFDENCAENNTISENTLAEIINKKRVFNGKFNFSCSQLKQFSQCPRSWFLNSVMKVKEQSNEAELVDNFAKGNLYHKILELYSKELQKKNRSIVINQETDGLFEEDEKVLEEVIEEAIRNSDETFLTQEIFDTTKAAISREIKETVTVFSRTFYGCKFFGAEIGEDTDFIRNDLRLIGKVDAVLYDPAEDEYIIVDYKTGTAPDNLYFDENDEKSSPDFQIPAYVFLLANSKKKIQVENACFFSTKDNSFKPVFGELIFSKVKAKNPVSKEEFEATMKYFEKCVYNFADNATKGILPVSEKNQGYSVCNNCDYRAVCRRVFQISKSMN